MMMITKFKIYEEKEIIFDDKGNYIPKNPFLWNFNRHLNGTLKIKDTYLLEEYAKEYFNWKIPNELKYEGTVYRMLQFKSGGKEQYEYVLNNGFIPYDSQRFWSCTKDLDSIKHIKKNLEHHGYVYYIIFKFDVTYNDVLFDVNKMYSYLNPNSKKWTYDNENEVLVLTQNFPKISPKNIIEHGEFERIYNLT